MSARCVNINQMNQMRCPTCQFENPAGVWRCRNCNAALNPDATPVHVAAADNATIVRHAAPESDRTLVTPAPTPDAAPGTLTPGRSLGGRYSIVRMLGEGGMGAVYEARDLELDRVVALKVIRPEYANQTEILNRFKQELILARQITHKNVVRIFDLGQAEGIRYITMEFVQGQDLHTMMTTGHPFTIADNVRTIKDTCRALEAAHAEGVVHRDLKTHNILIETGGRTGVMDFGIARSMQDSGLTSTGTLMGTPAYMSPEQAKGEKIDTRSDLFSLGVIFYELLTGKPPYESESMLGLLLKRVQERPRPPIEVNNKIPQALSDVVLKCLAVERDQRYQTAGEVIRDLDAWTEDPATFRPAALPPPPPPQAQALPLPPNGSQTVISHALPDGATLIRTPDGQTIIGRTMLDGTTVYQTVTDQAAVNPGAAQTKSGGRSRLVAMIAAAVLILAVAAFGVRRYMSRPPAPVAPMTVMIADFSNHTGDPVFDGTLESALKLAMEGATFINAYDRTRMRDLGLKALNGPLDESAAMKIAVAQGLNVVVSGSLEHRGNGYQLSVRAIQAVTGKVVTNADETAPGKDQVLFAVTTLAGNVRKALGDATSDSAQRFSMETLTAASLEAVHEYALALDALSSGRNDEAFQRFSKAVDLDANFGLAYAGMASASHNVGRQQDAEKFIKEAITHIDHMTERERYRTRAFLYLLGGNQQKCVDEYGTLLSRYPSDTGAANNVAVCLTHLRNFPEALKEVRRAVAILPKRATYHVNLSLYSSYAGDFETASKEAAAVLELNPAYASGFQALAFAGLGHEQTGDAGKAYQKLEKLSPSDAAIGFADLAAYEGRFTDATSLLNKGIAADTAARRPDAAADKFALLAYTQLELQKKDAALEAARNALDLSKAAKTRFQAARIYAALGEASKAHDLATGLAAEPQVEPQAYAKLIEGEIALKGGDPKLAVQLFTAANSLLDTWMGRLDLGRAYLETGAFTEADSEFDRCLKRRGETLALFLDEVPTYSYLPQVYYYQGRAREGMKSTGFAESYKKYLSIRDEAKEDPLLAEVRRRAGK